MGHIVGLYYIHKSVFFSLEGVQTAISAKLKFGFSTKPGIALY